MAYVRVPAKNHRLAKIAKKEFEKLLDKGYVDAEFVNTKERVAKIILTYENEPDLEWSLNAHMIRKGLARIDLTIPSNPLKDDFY